MKNVVTIGGGTGSSVVLSGIRNFPNISISALVPISDSGGSTGKLRKRYHIAAVGDARQVFSALSGAPHIIESMNKRDANNDPKGNLILADYEQKYGSPTASFAVAATAFLLQPKDRVVPITDDRSVELWADMITGGRLEGEHHIDLATNAVEKIQYNHKVEISAKGKEDIINADYIIICPGSLYTSLLPCLIVDGFNEALERSKAKIIFVESIGVKNLEIIKSHIKKTLDFIIPSDGLESDTKIIPNPSDSVPRSILRHDSQKLAKVLEKIIKK